MALVFGSLPLASRIFLGGWGFDGAAEIGCLCLIAGVYFYIVSRRFPAVPDPATILERAGERAASGRPDRAIALLTEGIRLSPGFGPPYPSPRGFIPPAGRQTRCAPP